MFNELNSLFIFTKIIKLKNYQVLVRNIQKIYEYLHKHFKYYGN